MANLSEASQRVLDTVLWGNDQEREEALKKLPMLADKKRVADLLVERLPQEENGKTRSWIVSSLAEIDEPSTVEAVAARIDADEEEDAWVRFWAAIGLAAMQPDDLQKRLVKAQKEDPDALIRMVSLRLLIENGFDGPYLKDLLNAVKEGDYETRWAACKALRRNAGHKPFGVGIETELIPVLKHRLFADREAWDTRYQAALALGNVTHKWQEAVEALSSALRKDLPDLVRRACVGGLGQISRPETKNALLSALQDRDAEIRVQAADALKETLGASDAVSFIVEDLLGQEELSERYLDALRQIDSTAAASALDASLRHPDQKIAQRAWHALTRLGGEEAVRILQRAQALDKYTELLGAADTQVMGQFNRLMIQAHGAFWMSMSMHSIVFLIGVGALIGGLSVALSEGFGTFERFVGVGTAIGSLGTLVAIFYKNPLDNIRASVTDLVQVNVIFLGYVRQINQIDATFKQMFLAGSGFGVDEMKHTVEQIQESVSKALEEVKGCFKEATAENSGTAGGSQPPRIGPS